MPEKFLLLPSIVPYAIHFNLHITGTIPKVVLRFSEL